ncbi:uncharacterized protein LOC126838641 [Adelges cooleyi]|uniref:uncharacterized protein LOC126838641 n=1 Tax=Adelges cooleyi TaxID=133065 RepID=UPI0021803F4A|nr:uncharacterized protein LOC126838641 [Adelges cooleyi]
MMNTENSTFVKQPSENVSQEIKEIYNEMTILLTKLFLIFIPRPIIVAVGIVLSVYYRWSSIIKCIKKIISSKMPKGEQPLLSENTPLIPVKDTSNEKVGVVKVDVEVKCLHHCGGKEEEKASQVATGFYYVKKIPKPIWIVIGAVAVVITMLILQMTLGGFIFCLLWIWCIWKSGQLSEENVPPVPVKDTLNEKVTQGQGENKKEFIGVVKVGVEVKGLHHQGDKDEGGASQGANGSSAVHVEQNTLTSASIVEGTECTTDTSGESNISKETT